MECPATAGAAIVKVGSESPTAQPAPGKTSRRHVVAAVAVGLGLLACATLAALCAGAARDQEDFAIGESAAASPRRAQANETPHTATCRDVEAGEPCHRHVTWAMQAGVQQYPEWYPGLTKSSTFKEFQAVLHGDRFTDCPLPCGVLPLPAKASNGTVNGGSAAAGGKFSVEDMVIGWQPMGQVFAQGRWCSAQAPGDDWHLDSCGSGAGTKVKVLTYNLFWWNLFGRRGGAGGSAGRLIASGHQGDPYDVMGFQECEDINRVLRDSGLQDQFVGVPGPHAMAIAYRRDAWDAIGGNHQDVAEDRPDQWYGTRAGMWIRLRHRVTGMNLLFVVHHGPLPVDTGGLCGGEATAFNIMKLIGSSASPGDVIVIVGDFNAGLNTPVVNTLANRLHKVYSGRSFGGVDHIYSSCNNVVSTRNLGPGGSDHDALDALLQFGI